MVTALNAVSFCAKATSASPRSIIATLRKPPSVGRDSTWAPVSRVGGRARAGCGPSASPPRVALTDTMLLHYNCNAIGGGVRDQITVRLPAELRRAIRRAARGLRRRESDVVRLALEAFLGARRPADRRPAEQVRHLIGSIASGVPDLAERHRERVLEAIRRA